MLMVFDIQKLENFKQNQEFPSVTIISTIKFSKFILKRKRKKTPLSFYLFNSFGISAKHRYPK